MPEVKAPKPERQKSNIVWTLFAILIGMVLSEVVVILSLQVYLLLKIISG